MENKSEHENQLQNDVAKLFSVDSKPRITGGNCQLSGFSIVLRGTHFASFAGNLVETIDFGLSSQDSSDSPPVLANFGLCLVYFHVAQFWSDG